MPSRNFHQFSFPQVEIEKLTIRHQGRQFLDPSFVDIGPKDPLSDSQNLHITNAIRDKRRHLEKQRGLDPKSRHNEVRHEPMGPDLLTTPPEIRQTMQAKMVRMAGPQHPQNRLDKILGLKTPAPGSSAAQPMAYNRAAPGPHPLAMPRSVLETARSRAGPRADRFRLTEEVEARLDGSQSGEQASPA
jgi:hypothetical protein